MSLLSVFLSIGWHGILAVGMVVDDNVAASFDGFDGHFSVARHSGLATDIGRNNINITCNMNSRQAIDQLLSTLNPQQKQAAAHGDGPLLIVAGAGTGKTATLVHRVAWQIAQGVNPAKILLLTFTRRSAGEMLLVTCEDEDDQTEFVIQRILEHRESGIELQRQAVLFRASHHSMVLEAELTRRNIPFHKYGGLKFIETAHVKDLMALLRLAENPRDVVSAMRLLLLLPGVGPAKAKTLVGMLGNSAGNFEAWKAWKPPEASKSYWPALVKLLVSLADSRKPLPEQVHQARVFYKPLLEEHYDNAAPRARDLEQIEHIATRYGSRGSMLSEITLDPPNSTQDLAGQAELDDDFLILSTIHSAKGLEWDCVHVIHAADGNIPSDMATGDAEQVEEERRLFYVALTRAKTWLYVYCPLRYYHSHRPGNSDSHGYAQLTRFLPDGILDKFERQTSDGQAVDMAFDAHSPHGEPRRHKLRTDLTSKDIRRSTKDIW